MPTPADPRLPAELVAALEDDLGAGPRFAELAERFLRDAHDRTVEAPPPPDHAALARLFDRPAPDEGRPLADVLDDVRELVLPNATWLHDPLHMGHQLAPPLPAAIWSEVLVGALNQSLAVAELSPATTAIERRVVRWLAGLAGLPDAAGGTMAVGATEATFTALLAARAAALPSAYRDGVGGHEAVVLASEHAHYSIGRAVAALGLGTRSCVPVSAEAGFRLDPDALAEAIDRERDAGRVVVAAVATSGSTAVGAFDDLEAIGAICRERGVWLHVDGAHGASALLSQRHRRRMRGVAAVTTLAWDAHKMLLLPLAAGVLLARDERLLDAAFDQQAPYLFHDTAERPIDQGLRSFQCSRRGDALKLWIAWQRYGTAGFAALYDRLCATTHAIWEAVCEHPRFEALHEPECNILCFRLRDDPELATRLRPALNASGEGWISLTRLRGEAALRVTVMNPLTTRADGERVLDALARLAAHV